MFRPPKRKMADDSWASGASGVATDAAGFAFSSSCFFFYPLRARRILMPVLEEPRRGESSVEAKPPSKAHTSLNEVRTQS